MQGWLQSCCHVLASLGHADLQLADALVETLVEFLPFVESDIPEAIAVLLELVAAVCSQRENMGYEQRREQYEVPRALVRLAAGLATADVPWAQPAPQMEAAAQGLLAFLVAGASCPDRPTSALAIEGLGGLQRARNRFNQQGQGGQATAEGGGVLPVEHEYKLLPSLLAHAHYPSEADVDLDDEEWVRVREEVIRLACLQSYCVLRHHFVRHCCEALQASMASGDWRAMEASLFGLAACGPSLGCRLEMAGPQIEAERAECEQLLRQLLGSCASFDVDGVTNALRVRLAGGAGGGDGDEADDEGDDEVETAGHALTAAVSRVVAVYAESGWLQSTAAGGDESLVVAVMDGAVGSLLSRQCWEVHCMADSGDCSEGLSYAMSESIKHSAAALSQLCRQSRGALARVCSAPEGRERLGRLIAAGSVWGGPSW